jgi:hypothetical protein
VGEKISYFEISYFSYFRFTMEYDPKGYVGFPIPGTPDYGIITPRDNFPGKIGLLDRLTFSIRT